MNIGNCGPNDSFIEYLTGNVQETIDELINILNIEISNIDDLFEIIKKNFLQFETLDLTKKKLFIFSIFCLMNLYYSKNKSIYSYLINFLNNLIENSKDKNQFLFFRVLLDYYIRLNQFTEGDIKSLIEIKIINGFLKTIFDIFDKLEEKNKDSILNDSFLPYFSILNEINGLVGNIFLNELLENLSLKIQDLTNDKYILNSIKISITTNYLNNGNDDLFIENFDKIDENYISNSYKFDFEVAKLYYEILKNEVGENYVIDQISNLESTSKSIFENIKLNMLKSKNYFIIFQKSKNIQSKNSAKIKLFQILNLSIDLCTKINLEIYNINSLFILENLSENIVEKLNIILKIFEILYNNMGIKIKQSIFFEKILKILKQTKIFELFSKRFGLDLEQQNLNNIDNNIFFALLKTISQNQIYEEELSKEKKFNEFLESQEFSQNTNLFEDKLFEIIGQGGRIFIINDENGQIVKNIGFSNNEITILEDFKLDSQWKYFKFGFEQILNKTYISNSLVGVLKIFNNKKYRIFIDNGLNNDKNIGQDKIVKYVNPLIDKYFEIINQKDIEKMLSIHNEILMELGIDQVIFELENSQNGENDNQKKIKILKNFKIMGKGHILGMKFFFDNIENSGANFDKIFEICIIIAKQIQKSNYENTNIDDQWLKDFENCLKIVGNYFELTNIQIENGQFFDMENFSNNSFQMAKKLITSKYENIFGEGFVYGLNGVELPIECKIFNIVFVYGILSSKIVDQTLIFKFMQNLCELGYIDKNLLEFGKNNYLFRYLGKKLEHSKQKNLNFRDLLEKSKKILDDLKKIDEYINQLFEIQINIFDQTRYEILANLREKKVKIMKGFIDLLKFRKVFLLTRHGATISDEIGGHGADDEILTQLGIDTSKKKGTILSRYKIDTISCSSILRAVETSDLIANMIGFPTTKIKRLENLRNPNKSLFVWNSLIYLLLNSEQTSGLENYIRNIIFSPIEHTELIVSHKNIIRYFIWLLTNFSNDELIEIKKVKCGMEEIYMFSIEGTNILQVDIEFLNHFKEGEKIDLIEIE